jgi:hypothetical protein
MLPPFCDTTQQKKEATEATMSQAPEPTCVPEGYKTNSTVHEQDLSNQQVSMPSIYVP